ncbi:MAG: single-stranded DNA-binding protein [Bacteroidota bacterium]
MMNLKNSVQLIGHLGKDPEVRRLDSGAVVANLTIATSYTYKNGKGEKVTETQWHRLVAWNKTAEIMEKVLRKGHEIAVQGKLTHNTYEDKEGITRYMSQVVVNEFVRLTKIPNTV